MITIMLAEEREKKNLKTLFLSGIHSVEYLISILFYPVVFSSDYDCKAPNDC